MATCMHAGSLVKPPCCGGPLSLPSRALAISGTPTSYKLSTRGPHVCNRSGCCCRFRQQVAVLAAATGTGSNGTTGVLVAGPSAGSQLPIQSPGQPSSPAASQPECSAPAATYQKLVALGAAKATSPLPKAVLLSLLAGAFVGFGAMMVLNVGAACPGLAASNPGLQRLITGSFGLPTGLLCVLICGAELFTGNTMVLTMAVLEGLATPRQLIKNWIVSFTGNLVGSLALVSLVSVSGLISIPAGPAKLATAKASLTFVQAFTRGVIANWMVCLAVWLATSASSLPGKAIGAFLPVSAFAAIGAEHSVANMFTIPMGIAVGAPVTMSTFFSANLLPVVLGNIVGGAICTGAAFAVCYGRLGAKLNGQPAAAK